MKYYTVYFYTGFDNDEHQQSYSCTDHDAAEDCFRAEYGFDQVYIDQIVQIDCDNKE